MSPIFVQRVRMSRGFGSGYVRTRDEVNHLIPALQRSAPALCGETPAPPKFWILLTRRSVQGPACPTCFLQANELHAKVSVQ